MKEENQFKLWGILFIVSILLSVSNLYLTNAVTGRTDAVIPKDSLIPVWFSFLMTAICFIGLMNSIRKTLFCR